MSTNESEVVNDNNEENAAGTSAADTTEQSPAQPVAEKSPEEKISELNDRYLRLYSEFDNYRKRTQRERAELLKTAGEDIYKNMLPLLDDIERALKSNEKATDIKAVNEGLSLIHSKFSSALKHKGLEPIQAIGQPFNVDLHEAITNAPAPSEDLKGKVIDEVEKGYTLNGKVIRFSKVVVGS
ncbi:MAG TPA: nucleotide exchange factor GrpE [Bacteroidia bacterium]|jgi:molecular chaperone GrpE|nr:nucleotide exchange factor GrpE [Bacteroidia bacterium]